MANWKRVCGFITLLAIGAASLLWQKLDRVVQAIADGNCSAPGCLKLKAGLQMAGGDVQGMAHALREKVRATVVGPRPTKARQEWRNLVNVLSDIDRRYLSQTGMYGLGEDGDTEVAEGFRMATQLVQKAFDIYVEGGDPARPAFTPLISPSIKIQGDNPDAQYYIAVLDDARAYRMRGRKHPDSVYFSVTTHVHRPNEPMEKVSGAVNFRELSYGAVEGDALSYCVDLLPSTLSPAEREQLRNPKCAELTLLPHTVSVVTRHYWENVEAAALDASISHYVLSGLQLEVLGEDQRLLPSSPMGDDEFAEKLARATKFIFDHSVGMPPYDPLTAPGFFSLTPNRIGTPEAFAKNVEGMGAIDIVYAGGPFSLKPGQGLLLEGTFPEIVFMNCLLWNRFLQTFDYAHRTTSLNRKQLQHGTPNKSYRILVADSEQVAAQGDASVARDFDLLDTEGRARGTVFFRFILPESEVEQPRATVVDLATMKPVLADTERIAARSSASSKSNEL